MDKIKTTITGNKGEGSKRKASLLERMGKTIETANITQKEVVERYLSLVAKEISGKHGADLIFQFESKFGPFETRPACVLEVAHC